MQIFRTFGLVLLSLVLATVSIAAKTKTDEKNSSKTEVKKQQQLVENVDIQGNRRLRDDDLLYYIKTRQGDVYSPVQLERDLKELLSLNFFDAVLNGNADALGRLDAASLASVEDLVYQRK